MVDTHSHILQSIDHGAGFIDESILILKNIVARNEVKKIFLTPHFMPGMDEVIKEQVLKEFEKLKAKVVAEKISIEIFSGAEMRLTSDSLDFLKAKKVPTLNNSRYLLVELSYEKIPLYAEHYLFEIQRLGYQPIIAHFDRAGEPSLELAKKWKERGILFQATTYSLSGIHGNWAKKLTTQMLEEELIDFIGSDIHTIKDAEKYAIDLFFENFPQIKISQKYWQKITIENPEKIIKDEQF